MVPSVLIFLVALLHFYFLILEMFFWTKPLGLKVFRQTLEKAEASKVLAMNQGLYNGFLGAGLIWSLASGNSEMKIFLLLCVVAAGILGAATVSRKIFYVQALPAVLALVASLVEPLR